MVLYLGGTMKRKERTEILIHCENSFLDFWVKKLETENQFSLLEEPSHSLTMVKVRESAQYYFFYLCEVLISEAKVRCQDKIGIGMIQGIDLDKAKSLAIIDAAYEAQLPIIAELDEALKEEQERQREQMLLKADQIQKTKVNFEVMDV